MVNRSKTKKRYVTVDLILEQKFPLFMMIAKDFSDVRLPNYILRRMS